MTFWFDMTTSSRCCDDKQDVVRLSVDWNHVVCLAGRLVRRLVATNEKEATASATAILLESSVMIVDKSKRFAIMSLGVNFVLGFVEIIVGKWKNKI